MAQLNPLDVAYLSGIARALSQGEVSRFDSWQGTRGAGGRGRGGGVSFIYSNGDRDLPNNSALLVRITSITKKPTIFFSFKTNPIAGILW